jgi:hypothetical protein
MAGMRIQPKQGIADLVDFLPSEDEFDDEFVEFAKSGEELRFRAQRKGKVNVILVS